MKRRAIPDSKANRWCFLRTAGLGLGALAFTRQAAFAAGEPFDSFAKPSKISLRTVTYNLAKDWDVPTLIKNCEEAKFEGVELRTSHAHGVEVTLR